MCLFTGKYYSRAIACRRVLSVVRPSAPHRPAIAATAVVAIRDEATLFDTHSRHELHSIRAIRTARLSRNPIAREAPRVPEYFGAPSCRSRIVFFCTRAACAFDKRAIGIEFFLSVGRCLLRRLASTGTTAHITTARRFDDNKNYEPHRSPVAEMHARRSADGRRRYQTITTDIRDRVCTDRIRTQVYRGGYLAIP